MTDGAPDRPLLRCSGVSKTYQSDDLQVVALRNVDLSIGRGEFVSLVGPSGCGKTTLLKVMAGIISSSGGTIDFESTGRTMKPKDFGMVFQQAGLLPWRTVLANTVLPMEVLGRGRRSSRERARELLKLMHLPETVAPQYPTQLSGGMQQRVAIARALMHDPPVILMDEPFGALDAMTRESLNLHLQQVHLAERKTVVFVTHSITEAVLLSDRIVVMHANPGRVAGILDVALPRPRRLEDMASEAFRDIELDVRRILDLNRDGGERGAEPEASVAG